MKSLGSQKEVTMFYSKCARKPTEAIKQEMAMICVFQNPLDWLSINILVGTIEEAKRLMKRRERDEGGLGEHGTSGDGNKW